MNQQHTDPTENNEYHQEIKIIFKETLKEYSKIDTACIFSALLLNPSYQSSQYRLEKAVAISLSFCEGTKRPDNNLINFILEKSFELFGLLEDPAEEVFISIVWFENEQYKLSAGLWEGGIYNTQIFLDFIDTAPKNKNSTFIKNRIRTILKASDLIITKIDLKINEVGDKTPVDTIVLEDSNNLNELIDSVKLQHFDKSKFLPCIDINNLSELYTQEFGASDLEESPFFINGESCSLILPSSVLVCIKRQIINFVRNNYSNELLNSLFFNCQANRLYNTRLLRKFKNVPIQFRSINGIENWMSSDVIFEFDKGYFFHFIFLGENLSTLDSNWFSGFTEPDEHLSNYIDKSINKVKDFVIEKKGGGRGCTIIVPCGFGKGLALGLNFKSDIQWMLTVIHSHDLDTLSNDPDCSPHKVWRIIESLEQIITMGVRLLDYNGFFNTYAYAKQNNYCLLPHESFKDPSNIPSNIFIALPSNSQVDVRKQVYKDSEKRLVYHHELGAVKVTRAFVEPFFLNNNKYDIYCLEEINQNIFQCIYIQDDYEIWIEQKLIENHDFPLQYQCFEAALSWVHKIFTVIKNFGLVLPDSLQVWNLSFIFQEDTDKLRDCPEPEKILSCFTNTFISPVLYSSFETDFLDGLRSENNFSEQALILSLVSYICDFNKITDYKKILNKIIESPDAKYMHSFVANKYREFFIKDKENPIYIEQTDENNIKLNLGWHCRNRSQGNIIETKKDCKKYLNEFVGNLWELIRKKLGVLNRELLIKSLLKNMELANHQKERWERSFKANLALHKNKENLYSVVNDKLGQLNRASLSSRLVIEMAICESPLSGGKEAGVLDIQELICLASEMHYIGGVSEAINYDLIEPKLVISTFGDIIFDHDFENTILTSYASKINELSLANKIQEYPKNLEEKEPVKTVNNLFEDDFNKAWIGEFGFTLDDARVFIDKLEDYGLKKKKHIYQVSYENLVGIFNKEPIEIIEKIISELVIYPRNSWTEIPPPFKPSDWQPWRFRRRFSLSFRPLVQFDSSNFLVSPQHVRDAFHYLVSSCHSATLDENHFSNHLMKKWIGTTRGANGLAFNLKVANRLQELGWTVKKEIKLTEILNQKLPDFGDVDVFAWNKKLNIVAVIECKDLDYAKTLGEISRQIYDFKGQKTRKGKKDRLLKHIDRLNILMEHKGQLSKFVNISSDIGIKGYVVFSNTVPMVFNDNRSYKDKVEFLTFDQLEQLGK